MANRWAAAMNASASCRLSVPSAWRSSAAIRANIGAGTIFCNYDGFEKFETTVGEGAFIGSNTALVAPVTVGDKAMTASGSVITKDVAPGDLALARAQQTNKTGWADAFRSLKAKKKSK